MEFALDDATGYLESCDRKHDFLPLILAAGLAAHFVIIYLVPYEPKQRNVGPVLDVTLLPARTALRHAESRAENEINSDAAEPLDVPSYNNTRSSPEQNLTDRNVGIVERALQQARQLAKQPSIHPGSTATQYRRFGLVDLENEGEAPNSGSADYFRSSFSPTYIKQSDGVGMEKVGRYCFQQRGDLNDRSTWRWHRVRAELCGHL